MPQLGEIGNKVHRILTQIRPKIGPELGADDDLFALGLDSQAVVEFVLRLEDDLGVEFELEDISFDSFRSVSSIERLLDTKMAGAGVRSPKGA